MRRGSSSLSEPRVHPAHPVQIYSSKPRVRARSLAPEPADALTATIRRIIGRVDAGRLDAVIDNRGNVYPAPA